MGELIELCSKQVARGHIYFRRAAPALLSEMKPKEFHGTGAFLRR
jgi:hypothetical protein